LTTVALKGRFLHITDIHPDPHYKTGASFASGCHRIDKKSKGKSKADDEFELDNNEFTLAKDKEKDRAGQWGSAVS
jgi:endopolyphosphatase